MKRTRRNSEKLIRILKRDTAPITERIREFQALLLRLAHEGKASQGRNYKELREDLSYFRREVGSRMGWEERELFSYLKRHVPKVEPLLTLLRIEHHDFKNTLLRLESFAGRLLENSIGNPTQVMVKIRENGIYLACLLICHFEQENEIFRQIADREIRSDEVQDLAELFNKR